MLTKLTAKIRDQNLAQLRETVSLYIAPFLGKFNGDAKPEEALAVIASWLNSNNHCLLLKGDSGAGKTLFAQWLVYHYWQNYQPGDRLVFFIPLLTQKTNSEKLLEQFLKKSYGLEKAEISLLKQQSLLLILDGFDEMPVKQNLYRKNNLQVLNVKVLFTCRSQALTTLSNYKNFFIPYNAEQEPLEDKLEEWSVKPFEENQITAYLKQYVSVNQSLLAKDTVFDWVVYADSLKKIPSLQALVASPFALSMVVEVFPAVLANHQHKKTLAEQLQWTRLELYDRFMEKWFARQAKKLKQNERIPEDCLFEDACKEYCKGLAYDMLERKKATIAYTAHPNVQICLNPDAKPVRQAEPIMDNIYFEDERLCQVGPYEIKLGLIRYASPLKLINEVIRQEKHTHTYAFFHDSLREYFAARQLFEGAMVKAGIDMGLGMALNERNLADNYDIYLLAKEPKADELFKYTNAYIFIKTPPSLMYIRANGEIEPLKLNNTNFPTWVLEKMKPYPERTSLRKILAPAELQFFTELITLNEGHTMSEHTAILQFLADKAKSDPLLQQLLFDVIEESKHNEWTRTAAANAMTILNYARVSFSNRDLSRARFPGADLRLAVLDSANLKEADARRVNFQGAYLQNANLAGAFLDNASFGELPYLKFNHVTRSYAYSPDDKWIAVGDWTGYIYLYDQNSHKLQTTFQNWSGLGLDKNPILSLCFDKQAAFLAVGSQDKLIRLWEIKSNKCVRIFKGHADAITTVAIHHASKRLASASNDQTLRVWDIKTGDCMLTLKGHNGGVTSLGFNEQGNLLVSGSEDGTVRGWDTISGECLFNFSTDCEVNAVAFSPSGKFLASGQRDGIVRFWDKDEMQAMHSSGNHTEAVCSIAFSPDGKYLVSGSQDKTLKLWDCASGQCIKTFSGHKEPILNVAFSHFGATLISASEDGTVRRWKLEQVKDVAMVLNQRRVIRGLAASADQQWLAAGSRDKELRIWDTYKGDCLRILSGHTDELTAVAFSTKRDSQHLVSGSKDKTLKLWDIHSGHCIRTFSGHTGEVYCIAISSDDLMIASGGHDRTLKIWDLATGECRTTFAAAHKGNILCLGFSPDRQTLASGGQDELIKLWDVQTGKVKRTLQGHTEAVNSLEFSESGEQLLSASKDKTLRLWNVKTGYCLKMFTGHTDEINQARFSPDNQYLVSGSGDSSGFDKTLRIWHAKTGHCLHSINVLSSIQHVIWLNPQKIAISFGKDIACYAVEKGSPPRLEWSTLLWLEGEQLNLSQVTGLDESDYQLLVQHGAKGSPNPKNTDSILDSRRQAIPFDPKSPPRTLFSKKFFLAPEKWAISLVRKKGNLHAFLLLESIQDGHYCLQRIDLFLDQKQANSSLFFNSVKRGKALILNRPKHLLELGFDDASDELHRQAFLKKHALKQHCGKIEFHAQALSDLTELIKQKYCYKTWEITVEQAKQLLANIEQDQKQGVNYLELGNSKLYGLASPDKEQHNCLTWCEKQLLAIGLDDVKNQQTYMDMIVASPQQHLPENEKQVASKEASCLLM